MLDGKLANIQALRGLAAFAVFVFHSLPYFEAMGLNFELFETFFSYGYIGVDIFFIISGLVMAKSTAGLASNIANASIFLIKRLTRIFMGYWPILLLAIALIYIDSANSMSKYDFWGSFFLLNIPPQELVISASWTLSYELYFYLFITALLLSPYLNKMFIMIFFALAVLFVNFYTGNQKQIFFFSSFILEFLAGYALFYVFSKIMAIKWLLVFVILGLISAYLMVFPFYRNEGLERIASVGVFSLVIVYLVLLFECKYNKIMPAFIQKMGDASYTLYLCHLVLLGLFNSSGLMKLSSSNVFSLLGYVLLVVSIVFISIVLYFVVEKPLYKCTTRTFLSIFNLK
ncbi:MAG: acyltransferase [Marinicella sp.]